MFRNPLQVRANEARALGGNSEPIIWIISGGMSNRLGRSCPGDRKMDSGKNCALGAEMSFRLLMEFSMFEASWSDLKSDAV